MGPLLCIDVSIVNTSLWCFVSLPERRRSFYDNYQSGDHHHGNQYGGRQMQHYSGGTGDDTLEPDTTRTLFVGNIPRGTSVYELKDHFIRFGHILVS